MATRADLYAMLAALSAPRSVRPRRQDGVVRPAPPPPGGYRTIEGQQPGLPRSVMPGVPSPYSGLRPGGPAPILWGGQAFSDPAALVAWMNARGAGTNLAQFLGNHPGVATRYGQRIGQQAPRRPARPVMQPLHRALLRESMRTAY